MRSTEDNGCSILGSPLELHVGTGSNRGSHHHRTGLGKPAPSKWDDAQKWLVNLSRGVDKTQPKTEPRDSNAEDRRLIIAMPKKDHDPSSEDEVIETKKVDFGYLSCVRDMGTEMTPSVSQEVSRSATPVRAMTPVPRSPMASGSTTPVTVGNNMGVTVRRENEEMKGENVGETRNLRQDLKLSPLETRALAWDEAERAKYMARFKQEEVKIQAWENHQKRKAEMEMKRMEAKAERLKSRAQEKYTNKLASTRRIAEEKRAKAEAILNEKAVKTSESADYIRRTGHLPSSFSIKFPLCCSCRSCFSCFW